MFQVTRDPNGAADILNWGFQVFHPMFVYDSCWMPSDWDTNGPPEIHRYDEMQNHKYSLGTAYELLWDVDQALIESLIAQAVADGLLTVDQQVDLIEELTQYEARFFYAVKELTSCDAPGDYIIRAWASDTQTGIGDLYNVLEYTSLVALAIDFPEGVQYGELVPGVHKIVLGIRSLILPYLLCRISK
jgi:hypothetical protein